MSEDPYLAQDHATQGDLRAVKLDEYLERLLPDYNLKLNDSSCAMATFIACNAEFDLAGIINHWVPGFSMEELGEETFRRVSDAADLEGARQISEVENELERLAAEYADLDADVDNEIRTIMEVQLASLEDKLKVDQAWDIFRWRCKQAELFPIRVPADGDCLLWTWKCLEEDSLTGESAEKTADNVAKVQSLRMLLATGWRQNQRDAAWQDLCTQLFVPDVDAEESRSESKVKAEVKSEVKQEPGSKRLEIPVTPPKRQRIEAGCIDLLTPDDQDKQLKLQKVNKCSAAPGWNTAKSAKPELVPKGPATKTQKKKKIEKPQCAGLVDDDHSASDREQVPEVESAQEQQQEEEEGEEEGAERKRAPKKRPKSEREVRMAGLKKYLGSIGMDYLSWQAHHFQWLVLIRNSF